jgi:hypothetical protein
MASLVKTLNMSQNTLVRLVTFLSGSRTKKSPLGQNRVMIMSKSLLVRDFLLAGQGGHQEKPQELMDGPAVSTRSIGAGQRLR